MRALVTGGAGFIGSHLVDRLVAEGADVVVVDDLSTGDASNLAGASGVDLVELDVRDDGLAGVVARARPDVVFHLAAQLDLRASVADPVRDAEINIIGTLKVCEAARAADVPRVVVAGTGGTMYGEARALPTKETAATRPIAPYPIGKRVLGDYLDFYRRTYGLRTCSLALSNVYGPRQDPHGEAGVVAIFLRALLAGEPVTIFGDGEQTRDYLYVDDAVEAFVRALAPKARGTINVGTARETSVLELLEQCERATGMTAERVFAPARAGELQRSAINAAKAKRLLGWEPTVGLEDGIPRTAAWVRQTSSR